MHTTRTQPRTAFTLLELILVLAILGILMALLGGAVQRVRLMAVEAERREWLKQRRLGATIRREAPIRVLFIGNSYTDSNNLPEMLRTLAQMAKAEPPLVVETELVGGAKLKTHWDNGKAVEKIRSGKWDFVVLQEQSQTPLRHFGRDVFFYPYARDFARVIREQNAIPLFFMTWSRPDTPGPQQWWTDSYVGITREVHAEVAPAGMAWEKVRTGLPNLQLYADQGGHPTLTGTYVAACTFYATIYDRSPVGLPNDFTTPAGRVQVTPAEAMTIQLAAWQALQEVKPKVKPDWR
jgi:prepilin-type N-terminal cleavage/methylation domain-containing protein